MSARPIHPDEQALVTRADTDFEAFAELYRMYLPRIHDFAYRRTGNRQAAEDICSATFEAALRNVGQLQSGILRTGKKGGFAPWIFRIASRQIIAHYRREGRAKTDRGQAAMARLAPTDAAPADSGLVGIDDDSVLRMALGSLNVRYQQAISLRHLSYLDTAEAAAAMGLTKSAFSVVLARATKALRKEIDKVEQDRTSQDR